MKTDVPTYNFLLELIYEYQNRKNSVVFHVNFCFLILSFWGFSIMLFLICFFRHFIIPISVDYQYVTNNQQDSREDIAHRVKRIVIVHDGRVAAVDREIAETAAVVEGVECLRAVAILQVAALLELVIANLAHIVIAV